MRARPFNVDFPNEIDAKDSPAWATMAPGRNPEFKVHRNEGLANGAFSNKMYYDPVAKYHLENGVWVKVKEYQPPSVCECGEEFGRSGYYEPQFIPPGTRRMDRMPVCFACNRRQRAEQERILQEKKDRENYLRLKEKYDD